MIRITNLSHMTVLGWEKRYSEILKEFGYSKKSDLESAKLLNSLLKNKFPLNKLRSKVFEQNVFVIGAGPSLLSCISVLKRFSFITKIVADGAAKALIENNIMPDILVTDLDGDEKSLKKIGKGKTIMVVHAHGDNFDKLELVSKFKNCIGTTEAKSFGKIHNFGGFTDGDRCVFLAKHFKAKKIILFGMDFGNKIGKYSKTKITSKKTKIKEFSEEQVRDILELKDRITQQIEKHKEEIESLEKNLTVLNVILKQSSCTKASLLEASKTSSKSESPIPLTKTSDGSVIANAYVTPEQVSIILEEGVGLQPETPPFKSFFVERIIGEMKKKDNAEAENGKIQRESIIDCIINKNGSKIREIIIKNYRQKERINEIINTAAWSLSKMIDNSS